MIAVDSFEWFLEQSKNNPDQLVGTLKSSRLSSKPEALINAIEAARFNVPELKLAPVLKELLSQTNASVRFCTINALGSYYDAASTEMEYLSKYDPDPACRSLAQKIMCQRRTAALVSSYIAICLFVFGWAVASALDCGYYYLIGAVALFVLNFAVALWEGNSGGGYS